MVKKLTKTNPNLINLIRKLKKQANSENAAIWKDVAYKLSTANRKTSPVNIRDINKHSKEDETVLIPGKVLSNGELNNKVNVVALNFSKRAQEKIENAGGKCLSISEIMEINPKGSNIKIME